MTLLSEAPGARGAKRMMAMLLIAFTLSFADLALIGSLCEVVKKEFAVTDMRYLALCAVSFPLAFALASVPMAWLAERFNRRWIITLSLLAWGGFSIATGFAWNFWQLVGARAGVAVALAAVTPAAQCIISGYFPAGARARPMGVYGLGMPIGAVAGIIASAWITQETGWRIACYAIGGGGVFAAVLFRLIVHKGPPRPTPLSAEDAGRLPNKPSITHFIVGLSIAAFTAFAYVAFTFSMLQRNYELDFLPAAGLTALINGLGGALGMYIGGAAAQKSARRDIRFQARIPAIACLIAGALYAVALMQSALWLLSAFMFLGCAFHAMQFAPSYASLQDAAAPHKRALTAAWSLFFIGVFGLGFGPFVLSVLSQSFAAANFAPPLMFHGLDFATACATRILAGSEESCAKANASGLRQAMFMLLIPYLWAAFHFSRAAKTLRQDTGLSLPPEHAH